MRHSMLNSGFSTLPVTEVNTPHPLGEITQSGVSDVVGAQVVEVVGRGCGHGWRSAEVAPASEEGRVACELERAIRFYQGRGVPRP